MKQETQSQCVVFRQNRMIDWTDNKRCKIETQFLKNMFLMETLTEKLQPVALWNCEFEIWQNETVIRYLSHFWIYIPICGRKVDVVHFTSLWQCSIVSSNLDGKTQSLSFRKCWVRMLRNVYFRKIFAISYILEILLVFRRLLFWALETNSFCEAKVCPFTSWLKNSTRGVEKKNFC